MGVKNNSSALKGDEGRLLVVTWAALANGDTGDAFLASNVEAVSIQVEGTAGSGGSVTLEGNNDGTNFETLHDPSGNALTFTSAGIKSVGDKTVQIRPHVTAGDSSTALNVTVLMRVARRPG